MTTRASVLFIYLLDELQIETCHRAQASTYMRVKWEGLIVLPGSRVIPGSMGLVEVAAGIREPTDEDSEELVNYSARVPAIVS